ncbi:MAG: glycosyl transferase family 2 [Cyanobacteria bacterium RYN_339]|nr:glycosyl transferase family 2 [Cyanobacteria bacterium RYN_339]
MDEVAAGAEALARGDWGGARAAYERAIEADPGCAEALYRLGCLLRDQGNLDAAEPLFRRALAAEPARADVHADLGLLAWRRGDDDGALPHLERAVAAYPDNLRLAAYLAAALGEMEPARVVLARTLAARRDWDAAELCAVGRELLVEPATYRAWFGAIADHLSGSAPFAARAAAPGPQDAAGLPAPWDAVLAMPEPRRVSACMIVRDEAHNLPRLLASLQGAYDELVVLDTGSTDDTVAIATAAGARVGHFTWIQDFAAARNACLSLASGDWIFMVDGDHELDVRSRRAMRRFLQRPPIQDGALLIFQARVAEHFDGDRAHEQGSYLHVAVYPNDPDVRYQGALHEQIGDRRVPPRPIRVLPIPDLVLHHDGYTAEAVARHDKHARNMGILETELAARPDDPFVHYNLGLQLRAESRYADAIQHLIKAVGLTLKRGGALPPYVREAMILVAEAQLRLGRHEELAGTCEAGLSRYPQDADLLAMAGLARLARRDPLGAIAPLERALEQAGRIATGVSNQDLTGWVTRAALAVATHLAGDAAASQHHTEVLWKTAPDQQGAVSQLLRHSKLATDSPDAVTPILARIGIQVTIQRNPT